MINKDMKHFIYKTTHTNGKYYIGRHSTDNLDDGYIGSGRWVSQIKNKETLTCEILEFVESFDELVKRETAYLKEHFGNSNCMNMSNASTGWATGNANPMNNSDTLAKLSGDNHWTRNDPLYHEKISAPQKRMVNEGTHNLLGDKNPNKDGRNAKQAMKNGTHNSITNNPSTVNAEKGTHHWQNGKSPNADGKLNKKLIAEGRHNFLGPDLNRKRIEEGTHNFVGSESNLKRLAEGRHPSQQKVTCQHCGKTVSVGMYKRWHDNKCKKANKMITTFDQDIIDRLKTGLSPAQLSIQYEKEGKNIPSTYIKFVRDCVKNNMLEFLQEDFDVDAETRMSSVATTSRQYEKMRSGNYTRWHGENCKSR